MKELLNVNKQVEPETVTDFTSLQEDLTVIVGRKAYKADHETWPEMGFPAIRGGSEESESLSEQPTSNMSGGQMERQIQGSDWITVREAARRLGVTPAAIRKIIERRGLSTEMRTTIKVVEMEVEEKFVNFDELLKCRNSPRGPGGRPPKNSI